MDSKTVKSAFAAAGIKVRVKAFPGKFRVCRVGDLPHDAAASSAALAQIGLVDCFGRPGGNVSQPHEMFAYIPRS